MRHFERWVEVFNYYVFLSELKYFEVVEMPNILLLGRSWWGNGV